MISSHPAEVLDARTAGPTPWGLQNHLGDLLWRSGNASRTPRTRAPGECMALLEWAIPMIDAGTFISGPSAPPVAPPRASHSAAEHDDEFVMLPKALCAEAISLVEAPLRDSLTTVLVVGLRSIGLRRELEATELAFGPVDQDARDRADHLWQRVGWSDH